MRKSVVIIGFATPCFLGALLLFMRACEAHFMETETEYYSGLHDAAGRIEHGWIPDFLPPSSRNLYTKFNLDYNTGIVAFRFNPAESNWFKKPLIEVAADRLSLELSPPSWVYRREEWFPLAIITGDFGALLREGYRFYRIGPNEPERFKDGRLQKADVTLHPQKGVVFLWY